MTQNLRRLKYCFLTFLYSLKTTKNYFNVKRIFDMLKGNLTAKGGAVGWGILFYF